MRKHFVLLLIALALSLPLLAKDKEAKTVLLWPTNNPVIQATFGQFTFASKFQGSYSGTIDAVIENLSDKPFAATRLTLLFYDKDDIQIGTSSLAIVEEIAPHGRVRRQVSFTTTGNPSRLEFDPQENGTKAVLLWPKDNPVLQATFGQFRFMGNYQNNYSWSIEATVENLTDNPFPTAFLGLVFYDKDDVQIGTSTLTVAEGIAPHGKLRQQISFNTTGKPSKVLFAPKEVSVNVDGVAIRRIQMTFRSSPSGADVFIDGQSMGVTPKAIRIPTGSHTLVLTKTGYTKVEYPFEVGEHDGNGGLIEIDLGTSNDVVELRDGTTVSGDVLSMDLKMVKMNIADKPVEYPRNMVKRITMVQREVPTPAPQVPTTAQNPAK